MESKLHFQSIKIPSRDIKSTHSVLFKSLLAFLMALVTCLSALAVTPHKVKKHSKNVCIKTFDTGCTSYIVHNKPLLAFGTIISWHSIEKRMFGAVYPMWRYHQTLLGTRNFEAKNCIEKNSMIPINVKVSLKLKDRFKNGHDITEKPVRTEFLKVVRFSGT